MDNTFAVMSADEFREFINRTREINSDLAPGHDNFHTDRIKYVYPLDKNEHLVVLNGDHIIAMAGVETNPYDHEQLWIKYVSVDPEYRGQGLGRFLLEKVFQYAVAHGQKVKNSSFTELGAERLKHLHPEFEKKYPQAAFARNEQGKYVNSRGQVMEECNFTLEREAASHLPTEWLNEASTETPDAPTVDTTKDGQTITFERFKDIEGNKNRGWRVDKIEAKIGNELVGYIKISYIPKTRFRQYYKSVFNFAHQMLGQTVFPFGKETASLESLNNKELFDALYRVYREKSYSLAEQLDPKMPRKQVMLLLKKQELAWMNDETNEPYGEKFKKFYRYHVDKPMVDAIRVEDGSGSLGTAGKPSHLRRGIGRKLYAAASEWMQERGLRLHASGCQTNDAKACWTKFDSEGGVKSDADGRRYIDFMK
jgi:GNAT superfamily N-acetyltransferase